MGLHRVDSEVEHGGYLFLGLVEHVLEDHHTALHSRKLRKSRHRCFDRFPSHHYLHRISALRIGDLLGRLNRLGRTDRATAQKVERAVVGNAEQPGAHGSVPLQFVQRDEGPGEGVLHDILAVDHRAHQPRAVAMKLRPQFVGERQELGLPRCGRRGRGAAQATSPSSTVIPVSPFRPKAKPVTYCGSSSTETTLSPTSRGGIGAPKRAKNASVTMPAARRSAASPASPTPVPPLICCGAIAWKRMPRPFGSARPLAYLAMNQSMRLAPA